MLSKDGEIRRDESCVDYAGQNVMIFPCHGMKGNQEWKYDHQVRKSISSITNRLQKGRLLHAVTNKCLEMSKDGAKLLMTACDESSKYQQWKFKDYNEEKARQYGLL